MQNVDFYGKPINLTLNESEKIKTKFGGFMTILSIFLIFCIIWFLGNDIIYKKNPQTITENNIFDNFTEIDISFIKVPFGIALTDEYNNLIKIDNYFDINLEYAYYSYSLDESQKKFSSHKSVIQNLNASRCNLSVFNGTITEKQFTDSQFSEYYCPIFENVKLSGYWTEKKINLLTISISKCNNKTKSYSCKSIEEIDKFIKINRINFNINFLQPRIQFNNFQIPVTYSVMNYYRYLTSNSLKYYYFNIQKNEFYTDTGLAFETINGFNIYEPVLFGYDDMDFSEESQDLMVVEIYSANKNKVYTRSYIKLGTILANFGGIIKLFSTIFVFLNSIFGRIRFLEVIINELFLIKENKYFSKRKKIMFSKYNLDMMNFELLSKRDFRERYLVNIEKKSTNPIKDDKISHSKSYYREENIKDCNKNHLIQFQDTFEAKINNKMQNEQIKNENLEDLSRNHLYQENGDQSIGDVQIPIPRIKTISFINENINDNNHNKINQSYINTSNDKNKTIQKDSNRKFNLKSKILKSKTKFFRDSDNHFKYSNNIVSKDKNISLLKISNYKEEKLRTNSIIEFKLKVDSFSENFKNNSITDSNDLSKRSNNSKTNLLNNHHYTERNDESKFKKNSFKNEHLEDQNENNLILLHDTRLMKILENLKRKDQRNKFKLNLAEVLNFLKVNFLGINKLNNKFTRNFKILKEGEQKISQYLNLVKIIEKFERIDFMTKLMFKDYQKSILDIINIPILDISQTTFQKETPKTNANDPNLNKYIKKNVLNRNLCSKENIEAISVFLKHYDIDLDPKNKNIFKSLVG